MAQNYNEERSVMAPAHVAEAAVNGTPFTNGVCRSLYIGGAGNASLLMPDNSTVIFSALAAGTVLPVRASQVNTTGTTATDIVALF